MTVRQSLLIYLDQPIGYVPLDSGSFGSRLSLWIMKIRTIVYFDGFNFYHAVDELKRPELKWVNLWSLSESLVRENETLIEVNYFTAYTTWIPSKYYRHRQYVAALEQEGVSMVFGQFKDKFLKCRKCGREYSTKEEKETDVNIALRVVTDALQDRYDRAIVVSADTDLKPAVDTARHLCPDKQVSVFAPPGRMRRARSLNPNYEIKPGRIAQHQLKDEYKGSDGAVLTSRPSDYR